MSVAEILHRVGELAQKQSARLVASGWARFGVGDGPLPTFPVELDVSNADEALVARWRHMAEETMAGRFRLLGVDWPQTKGKSIWHFDPVSQREWPRNAYCFEINYRHSDRYGDIKYVWEVNRLQHLQPLAALARITGSEEIRAFVVAEIDSWIADNPPFLGVNWSSGIELSLRAISILIATQLLGEEAFSEMQRRSIRSFLAATGMWISRYPSRFSSANNHLIAEAVGLLAIATACPDLPGAKRWLNCARRILADEAERQFHADGIGAEQSPTYTAFTLELYLTAAKVAEAGGKPLPRRVMDRLTAAGSALSWFMDENGEVPRIGDDDEGRVIVSDPQSDRLYAASVLSATAAVCGRAYMAPPSAPAHLRDFLFGRGSGQIRGRGVRCFSKGGYTVLRDRVHDKQVVLAMDHAPLGYLSIAAHGHADTLAVWLTYGGKALLADAGTYLYHAGGAWRDAFRGTQLHNTLSVSGENSSLVSGAFNWKAKAAVEGIHVDCNLEAFHCRAVHDGYLERFGVKHARSLMRVSPDIFTIEDRLEGTDDVARAVTISFVAGEGVEIVAGDENGVFHFIGDGKAAMRLQGPQGLTGRIVRGLEDERLGWMSPCFGRKQPTFHLLFEGTAFPRTGMVTELRLL
jgi:hypothetical protein